MSAEPAATIAAPANAADQNAQAAEDAKRMLAELQGGVEAGSVTKTEEHSSTNGKSEAAEPTPGKSSDTLLDGKEDEVKNDKKNENEGVSEKNARGNQRPGHGRDGYNNRSRRENIKSDLTTQKESRDPVEIRKQVCLWLVRFDPKPTNISLNRSNSTSRIQTFPWTNFF